MKRGAKPLSKRQKHAVELFDAMGELHVLAVGVSNYTHVQGFSSLGQPKYDAKAVLDCFADVRQLNAAPDGRRALVSDTTAAPTRGRILGELERLAARAAANDRVLFYYSGHGVRIGTDEFALVPEDAFSADSADALVVFSRVMEILNKSRARQRLIVIDACYSGPDTTKFKSVASRISRAALIKYTANTSGVAVLGSSPSDSPSLAISPNPQLSLMTHFLVRALRGDPEALQDGLLTLNSLHEYVSTMVQREAASRQKVQQPVIQVAATGDFLLGDFSAAILDPEAFDVSAFPIRNLVFSDTERLDTTDVLTQLQRFRAYSTEYIERKVNEQLEEFLQDRLGKLVSSLRRELRLPAGSVSIEGPGLVFPGGRYALRFEGQTTSHGLLVHTVELGQEWFARNDIPKLIDALGMTPSEFALELSSPVEPLRAISGLESRGWQIESELPHEVRAVNSLNTSIAIETGRLVLRGFAPSELFGDDRTGDKAQLVAATIARLLAPQRT